MLDHIQLGGFVLNLFAGLPSDALSFFTAAKTSQLLYWQHVSKSLARQVRRKPSTTVASAWPHRLPGFAGQLLIDPCWLARSDIIASKFEQRSLVRIQSLTTRTILGLQKLSESLLQAIQHRGSCRESIGPCNFDSDENDALPMKEAHPSVQ